jgi:multifunctional methyltransferase subunit TRM112
MRILTHNSLRCVAKGATKGYPLQLGIEEMEIIESDFNPDFIISILPSLDWEGVLVAATAVGIDGMPPILKAEMLNDLILIQAIHKLLLDVHVTKGVLTCPDTGRQFKIENGIPLMM